MEQRIPKKKWKKIIELDLIIKQLPVGAERDAYNRGLGVAAAGLIAEKREGRA